MRISGVVLAAVVLFLLPLSAAGRLALFADGGGIAAEAARVNGAGPWQVLRRVILPLMGPAFLTGFALAFVSALGNFGAPALLGIPGAPCHASGADVAATDIKRAVCAGRSGGACQPDLGGRCYGWTPLCKRRPAYRGLVSGAGFGGSTCRWPHLPPLRVMLMLTAWNEVTLSSILRTRGTETLGAVIFNYEDGGYSTLSSAMSVISVLATLALMGILHRLGRNLPPGIIPWWG
ncbi:MAG: ABC transporter permease subunit [Paracoccaceae bacterium]